MMSKLKQFRFTHSCFLIGLLVARASGETVYDNGPATQISALEMTHWLQADDFTLKNGGRLQTVKFWDAEGVGSFQGSITWQIYSNGQNNSPGNLIFSGNASNVARALTGFNIFGYLEFVNTFDLSVGLPAGTYWLALHNGSPSTNTNHYFYWETTNGNATFPSHALIAPFSGSWDSNDCPQCSSNPPSDFAFHITGVPGPSVTDLGINGGNPWISFTTIAGQNYRVEYKNMLTDSEWIPVRGSESVAGTGNVVQVSDPDSNLSSVPRRFYRVLML